MQNCCILDCKSNESTNATNIIYFKFPVNDRELLEKWLEQIGRKDWYPSDNDIICSAHFQTSDIDDTTETCPFLKPEAIPSIFSSQTISHVPDCIQSDLSEQMVDCNSQQHLNNDTNKALQLQLFNTVSKEISQPINSSIDIFSTPSAIKNCTEKVLPDPIYNEIVKSKPYTIPTLNNLGKCKMEKFTEIKTKAKIPVLKISITKMYNLPCTLHTEKKYKHRYMENFNNNNVINKTHVSNTEVKHNPQIQDIVTLPKPIIVNSKLTMSEKPTRFEDTVMEVKPDISVPKSSYTRKGDLSRDNSRSQTTTERLRYLYTKAQRDCDILRIRLRALRERHKQEKEKIRKLQMHLDGSCDNIKMESFHNISGRCSNTKKKSIILEDMEEEDEYEKLLREVRKIKKDMLDKNYPVIENKYQNNLDLSNSDEIIICQR